MVSKTCYVGAFRPNGIAPRESSGNPAESWFVASPREVNWFGAFSRRTPLGLANDGLRTAHWGGYSACLFHEPIEMPAADAQ